VGVLLFAATAASARSLDPALRRSQPAETESLGLLPAADAELVVGDWYELEVQRGQAKTSCAGCLIAANQHWLVLRSITVESNSTAVPRVLGIPIFGRVFQSVDSVRQEANVWVPREAARLTSRVRAADAMPSALRAPTVVGAQPVPAADCTLVHVSNKRETMIYGELTAVGDERMTLVVERSEEKHPHDIGRGDLLFLSVPVADSRSSTRRVSLGQFTYTLPLARSE
jgi:hypothetical protein